MAIFGWRTAKDAKPEDGEFVLIMCEIGRHCEYHLCTYEDGKYIDDFGESYKPVSWIAVE